MVSMILALSFLAGAASASGKYLSHTRYEWYYGDFSQGEFFKNSVAVSDYDEKSWATYPSENQVNILESVNFPVVDRMAETHIFTGLIRVPKCQSGVFKFRVTSDDAAHLLIDGNIRVSNPGVHAMQAVEHLVTLQSGHDHQFELWWGNYDGVSGLKLEYCYHPVATHKLKQLSVVGEDASKALADMSAELLAHECEMTEDLSKIMVPHNVASVRRCDYEGYYADDFKFFEGRLPSSKLIPGGCAEEVGGRITGWDRASYGSYHVGGMSIAWKATLKPENSGQHLFWTRCNDACHVLITRPGGDRVTVVNNGGTHSITDRHGRIFLEKGVEYQLDVYYGNHSGYGEFQVMYQDPTMTEPSKSFQSVLV